MRVRIVSDQLTNVYDGSAVSPSWATEYIAGCEHLIVPGVISWDNVQVARDGDKIVISADLVTEDRVTDKGDYTGDEVTEDFISSYVIGADAYWLAPEVLKATEVTFA